MSKYSENIPPSLIGAIGWFYDDIPKGAKVLDIGCSTGYYGEYIKQNKNAVVDGVELSDDRFEAMKVLDAVYSFDLDQEWPDDIPTGNYDVVFMGDVIEHLKDPARALRQVRKLLSEEGRLYISTPNIAHLSIRLELLGGGFEYESMGILDSTHLKYFTKSTLTNLVHEAGYDIERIDSSESDYPRGVAETILNSYGLKPTKLFWDLASSHEARAFQYKFVLKQRPTTKKKPAKVPSPVEKPEQYKTRYITELNTIIEQQTKGLEHERSIRQSLEKENAKIGSTLENILNSKAYKIAARAQKTKAAISHRRKKSGV